MYRVVSTQIATLESKLEKSFKTLICRFSVQPNILLHLPVKISARSDWGFLGEDGLLSLGCRYACHPPPGKGATKIL